MRAFQGARFATRNIADDSRRAAIGSISLQKWSRVYQAFRLEPRNKQFKLIKASASAIGGGYLLPETHPNRFEEDLMFRFSVALVAVLALIGATTIAVSPASAYAGAAYDKCMAKCQAGGLAKRCNYWCENKH